MTSSDQKDKGRWLSFEIVYDCSFRSFSLIYVSLLLPVIWCG